MTLKTPVLLQAAFFVFTLALQAQLPTNKPTYAFDDDSDARPPVTPADVRIVQRSATARQVLIVEKYSYAEVQNGWMGIASSRAAGETGGARDGKGGEQQRTAPPALQHR